jgi:integrase
VSEEPETITKEISEFLISESKKVSYSNSFRGARLRLALALLLVTGIRIGELLTFKMHQVKTLFVKHWIAIDRKKRGPSNHKTFLIKEGCQILQDRLDDFEFICRWKENHSYIFTAENSEKPLELEAFTRLINSFLKDSV